MFELSANTEMTMSSREIAELTCKEHKNVTRDIRVMLDELNLDALKFEHIYSDSMNRKQTEFKLNRDLTECLLLGYSAMARLKVIKRWHELEKQIGQPDWLKNLSPQALTVIEDLNNQVEVAHKEVDRLQGVCNTITAQFTPGVSAPTFCTQFNGVNMNQVSAVLCKKGVFIKESRGYRVSSHYRDVYFKQEIINCPDKKQSFKPVLTLKGAKWMYKLYLAHELPMKKDWDGKFDHVVFEDKAA
ncbi:Rha family transcriptional regulator [Methylophaga sp.]|uniref:Rha family transcriptional regulator n=1 Tax=Methylophaga sp. TaxID=2024840 RepID=UPI003A8CF3D6